MTVLCADALTCSKSDRQLFGPLSLQVLAGQLWYVRGPNGAGKTSLLRILAGLSQPDSGIVRYGNGLTAQHPSFQQQLVYIGHHAGNHLRLSAIENLTMWARLHQIPLQVDLYALLGKLGLVGLEDIPVQQLSAGQQRRVALARLWLKHARLWILDEPFTALDVQAIAMLEAKIASHLDTGGSVIMTSHQSINDALPVSELLLEYQW